MSFDPIKFQYTAPPAVPVPPQQEQPLSIIQAGGTSAQGFGSTAAANSTAAKLVLIFSDLKQTSQYLLAVIDGLTQGLGVTFNLDAQPELSMSLGRLYATDKPPSSMNMTMYKNLLAADVNSARVELLTGLDSTLQLDPIQQGDLRTATRAFENELIADGSFKSSLPLLMRGLMGDQVIFDSWTDALNNYPILSSPPPPTLENASTTAAQANPDRALSVATTDVSPDLATILQATASNVQTLYAATYTTAVQPTPVEMNISEVAGVMQSTPIQDVARVLSMLSMLTSMFHKQQLNDSAGSINVIILPILLSQVGAFAMSLDKQNTIAILPAASIGGSLGSLIAGVGSSGGPSSVLDRGLNGTIRKAAGGFTGASSSGVSPQALQLMAASISWAVGYCASKIQDSKDNLQRLSDRRSNESATQLEVMSSLRSLSTLIGAATAVVKQGSTGTVTSSGPNTQTGLQATHALLSSVSSQTGTVFAVTNNTLTAVPATVPPAPPNVLKVLNRGGANITQSTQLTQVNVNG